MIQKDRATAFMEDLWELEEMHGLFIGGCGCCGSPYLGDRKKGEVLLDRIDELGTIEDINERLSVE